MFVYYMEKILLENKPMLSESSIKTYMSLIRNVFKKIQKDKEFEYDWFFKKENAEKTIDFLENTPMSSRKTILSALVVLCSNHTCVELYRDKMMKDVSITSNNNKKQEMTPSQEANWVTQEDIKKVYVRTEKIAKALMGQSKLTMTQYQTIQDYILMAVASGVFIPPRRALDWCVMKVRGYDEEKDNYVDLKKSKFVFNVYKTAKTYKTQEVDIPKPLANILKKWIAIIPEGCDYLLFDTKKNHLSQPQLNKKFETIFSKKVSVNLLRHSYLTEKYKDMPSLKDMMETADDMGHTVEQAMEYVKKK